MHPPSFIEAKRDGRRHSRDELRAFVRGLADGGIPDSQVAAWAMAVFFRGLDETETATLTDAMADSGARWRHPDGPPVVDKHSTGGIGDKVSLVLAPLLACAGCRVPMVSGRGLGITGGTLDKLEAIPGFRVDLPLTRASAQLAQLGVALIGQTAEFCPADRRLYALRNATATVPSQALIVASIMSKKLAESLDRLALDVKFGTGAFMQTRAEAESLAAALVATGQRNGVSTRARLSPMDHPLGTAVGNSLEVIEALACLEGGGPHALRALVLDLAQDATDRPRETLARLLDDGSARDRFDRVAAAQGSDPADLPRLAALHRAPVIRDIPSPRAGRLRALDAGAVGRAALALGAGRSRPEDSIDPRVGFDRIVPAPMDLQSGDPLARVHAADESSAEAAIDAIRQAAHWDD